VVTKTKMGPRFNKNLTHQHYEMHGIEPAIFLCVLSITKFYFHLYSPPF